MSLLDLLSLIADNLGRRKARVALTAVGVVIGTAAVVILVSLAIGLQRNATEQLYGIGDLSQIHVMPNYGDYGPGPVEIDIAQGGSGSQERPNQVLVTDQTIADLAAMPGVQSVVAKEYFQGNGIFKYNRMETWANIMGMATADLSILDLKPDSGTLALERGTAVIGVLVPNNFYDPRQRPGLEPPPALDLLDQQLELTLSKWDPDGTEIRKRVQVRVVGILAETRTSADWQIYMPLEDVTIYNEWFQGRRIDRTKTGYSMATVKVENVDQVLDIADQISAMGYFVEAPQSYLQPINNFYTVLQVIFGGVGAIALLVAAIGIANTMAMAILERTREIGLMKAIGATNRDVLTVFLGEAAGIGFLGGLGGVLTGWSAGQIINVLVVVYLAGQAAETGAPPPSAAVITPTWLLGFTLIFATIIGLLSGLYPALRAATLIPINALKYE